MPNPRLALCASAMEYVPEFPLFAHVPERSRHQGRCEEAMQSSGLHARRGEIWFCELDVPSWRFAIGW
jgi:hypothetical protein